MHRHHVPPLSATPVIPHYRFARWWKPNDPRARVYRRPPFFDSAEPASKCIGAHFHPPFFIIDITRPDILRAKITGQRTEYNRRICGPRRSRGRIEEEGVYIYIYISVRSRSSRYLRAADSLLRCVVKRGGFWVDFRIMDSISPYPSTLLLIFLKSKRSNRSNERIF